VIAVNQELNYAIPARTTWHPFIQVIKVAYIEAGALLNQKQQCHERLMKIASSPRPFGTFSNAFLITRSVICGDKINR
jgi:hypothetical protein